LRFSIADAGLRVQVFGLHCDASSFVIVFCEPQLVTVVWLIDGGGGRGRGEMSG